MSGWKTWVAVIGTLIYAAVSGFINGDWNQAAELFLAAMALLGIGHKIEKVG